MRQFDHVKDGELLELLGTNEIEAFKELYERYWDKLFCSAYKRLRCRETAEELVQDFFTRLWINRKSLQIQSDFSAYAYTAMKYLVIKHIHKQAVRESYTAELSFNLKEQDNSTENLILLRDLTHSFEKSLQQLPARCQAVFQLSRKEHKSNKEIAEALGISEKTVENQITRAIKKIKVSLAEVTTLLLLWLIKIL